MNDGPAEPDDAEFTHAVAELRQWVAMNQDVSDRWRSDTGSAPLGVIFFVLLGLVSAAGFTALFYAKTEATDPVLVVFGVATAVAGISIALGTSLYDSLSSARRSHSMTMTPSQAVSTSERVLQDVQRAFKDEQHYIALRDLEVVDSVIETLTRMGEYDLGEGLARERGRIVQSPRPSDNWNMK